MTKGPILYTYAASVEGAPVARAFSDRCRAIGVGKVPAAVHLTQVLAEEPWGGVVAFGVCGAYREAAAGLTPGDLCVVEEDVLADEGVQTPQGFLDLEALGLESLGVIHGHRPWAEALAGRWNAPRVSGATVSTGSGTDARARSVHLRTRAAVETMEGAAIAMACRTCGVPWIQLRCVSNYTGDRERAQWDLARACERIQHAVLTSMREGWP